MHRTAAALLASAALAVAQCTIPDTPLSNNISAPFRLQVQNVSRSEIHDKYMNLFVAGGGDRHLFIGPVGVPTFDLTLDSGVINWHSGGIRAVIGGEDSLIDLTVKMFMTERGDPKAVFQPTYACNPDSPSETQVELHFLGGENHPPGGFICVRHAFDGGHEFRYYPPNNSLIDPDRECIKVTLVVRPSGDGPFSTATSPASSTASPTGTSTSTPTPTPTGLFTDMTALGFRFLGCAPEERRVATFDFAGRTLPSAMFGDGTMTNANCMAFCSNGGYKYAGTEWSRECWCANTLPETREPEGTMASLANCNFRCAGAGDEYCGGDSWISVYEECEVGEVCENGVFV